MKRSTIFVLLAIICLVLVLFVGNRFLKTTVPPDTITLDDPELPLPSFYEDVTPQQTKYGGDAFLLIEDMKAGWNLGNALDSLDHQKRSIYNKPKTRTAEEYYETLWGNPVTTEKVIADVAAMGFGAVRVPVTWQDHMDENFVITEEWLARVKQVVDYVINNNMYCIINLHHDVGSGSWPWLMADPDNIVQHEKNLRTVWTQIAKYFQDYSDKLLFEGFNEILDTESRWSGSTPKCHEAVNRLNQAFVDTVRSTGGKNSARFLIVATYAASIDGDVLSNFRLPTDTVNDHIIVSVHSYSPLAFSWTEENAPWAKVYSKWDNEKSGADVKNMLKAVRTNLVDKGIPVILSECGAWNKNNTDDRCAFAKYLVREAAKSQIACFWWDEGGKSSSAADVKNSALYDRYNEAWLFPEIAKAFVSAAEEAWKS